jgi:hypothetical protein
MMQIEWQWPELTFEGAYIYFAALFILFGIISYGWLVVHVEYGRHFSKLKALFALILGSLFLGFAFHFFLLSGGS